MIYSCLSDRTLYIAKRSRGVWLIFKKTTAESGHRSAVFLFMIIACLRLKNRRIYDIIRYRPIGIQ